MDRIRNNVNPDKPVKRENDGLQQRKESDATDSGITSGGHAKQGNDSSRAADTIENINPDSGGRSGGMMEEG